jgi:hypothetical protein
MIPVIRGPVEFVVAVAIMNGVLRLVSGGVDKRERLTHGRLTSACRTFPNKSLPGLRSGMERENRQRRLWLTNGEEHARNLRGTRIISGPTEVYQFAVRKSEDFVKYPAVLRGGPVPAGADLKTAAVRLTCRLYSSTFEAD